jgi:hypothetical protein
MGDPFGKELDLFQAVHGLFWQQDSRERRRGPRHPYQCTQLLAPYNGRELPRQEDFTWAECQNLSTRGLSFFWPRPPSFERVVVALGGAPSILLVARVVHFVPVGKQFLCGCQFERRIGREEDQPAADAQAAELSRGLLDTLVQKSPKLERE